MAGSQISGLTPANIMEVEAATKAARIVQYPDDYTTNGNYNVGSASGVMAAGLAAGSPIFSFQWTQATKPALIKRVLFSAGCGATAFAAGVGIFHLFALRAFTVADTGGTSILPASNSNKLKTSMATPLPASMRIASTGTLTAGTRTKDALPLASIVCGIPATAGTPFFPPYPLISFIPGEYPFVLQQNEGFDIEATVPITGTWQFGVKVEWGERDSYF